MTVACPLDVNTAAQLRQWNLDKAAAQREMKGIASQLQAVHRVQNVVNAVWVAADVGLDGGMPDLHSATQELDVVADYAGGMSQQLAMECRTLLHHCHLACSSSVGVFSAL